MLADFFIVPSLTRYSHFTFAGFHRRNIIRDACKAVGSLSESCFDIRFNPDVCSTGNNYVNHTFTYYILIILNNSPVHLVVDSFAF